MTEEREVKRIIDVLEQERGYPYTTRARRKRLTRLIEDLHELASASKKARQPYPPPPPHSGR